MTTTPNELRAAAETMANGDITCLHHKDPLDYDITPQARIIAEHYLSTLPPDADEPISEEWLREIGWTRVQLRLEMVVDGRTIELYDCVIADSPMRGLLVFFLKKTRKAYTIPLPSTIIAYIIHPSQST